MGRLIAFGRPLSLPSVTQIKHELRLLMAAEELRGAAGPTSIVLAGDLAQRHHLSVDRAQMLLDRYGIVSRPVLAEPTLV